MSPALIGVLLQFIPSIIQGVELAFRLKEKSGPDKKQAVVRAVGQIAESMLTAAVPLADGTLVQAQSVDDAELGGVVEAEYQRLKATGKLSASAASTDLFIVRGTVIAIPV